MANSNLQLKPSNLLDSSHRDSRSFSPGSCTTVPPSSTVISCVLDLSRVSEILLACCSPSPAARGTGAPPRSCSCTSSVCPRRLWWNLLASQEQGRAREDPGMHGGAFLGDVGDARGTSGTRSEFLDELTFLATLLTSEKRGCDAIYTADRISHLAAAFPSSPCFASGPPGMGPTAPPRQGRRP